MAAPRPTIADVARLAQVSIATVSRVLNRSVPVDAETAARVRAAVAELNYVPHAAARTLASRRTDTIGLLLSEIGGEFFQPMLRGIELTASQAGFDLLIHSTRAPRPQDAPHRPLGEHNTDGLLVFTDSLDGRELARLNRVGFPLVLLHQTPPDGLDLPAVTIENRSGTQRIVEHLIEAHGCRRIVFLRGPAGNQDSQEREQGYRRALKTHGLAVIPELIAEGGFDGPRAQAAVAGLLAAGIEFDALFTGDDDSAVGVYEALRASGRRVGTDVAVAGFDDSTFARLLTPPLTTVRAPLEQVGATATSLLVRIIRGESVEPTTVLPTEPIIRRSCGCQN